MDWKAFTLPVNIKEEKMVFLKRAGLYCIRQRFKTLILFLVLTLIASLILTGIAISDAVSGAAKNVKAAVITRDRKSVV